jgi:hypothetical protein
MRRETERLCIVANAAADRPRMRGSSVKKG